MDFREPSEEWLVHPGAECQSPAGFGDCRCAAGIFWFSFLLFYYYHFFRYHFTGAEPDV